MAQVPQGPGQTETIRGQASATPGTYKDPASGATETVSMGAGADALVRLGWQLVEEPSEKPQTPSTTPPQVK